MLYFPGGLVQVLYTIRDAGLAAIARRIPEPATEPGERPPVPAHMHARVTRAPDGAAIRVAHVSVSFDGRRVVDEADLRRWQSGLYYPDFTPKKSLAPVRNAILGARAGTLTSC